ncbi:hypothetical protein HN587_00280 [Candidatus Woesearchaeota archaeon]|jgi:hypothetical protein|nr:hypothetical protein [Candidatus Woesearchaeota archaeon]
MQNPTIDSGIRKAFETRAEDTLWRIGLLHAPNRPELLTEAQAYVSQGLIDETHLETAIKLHHDRRELVWGNRDIKLHPGQDLGAFTEETVREMDGFDQFFKSTPHIWTGSVLDIGCCNTETRTRLRSIYPHTTYTGLDLFEQEGVDIVHDARKKLPFQDQEFDVISVHNMMLIGLFNTGFFPNLFSGNINNWTKPLKDTGYFVASCTMQNPSVQKKWYETIKRTFKITEEFRYSGMLDFRDREHKTPYVKIYVICEKK